MTAITFDTLKFAMSIHGHVPSGQRSAVKHRSRRCFVETLEEEGVDNRVAKAISTAVRASHEAADWVTKADLREMELRMDAKFGEKFGGLQAEINSIKWMIGVLLAAVMTILIKSFF